MEPIINPWLIYFASIVENIGIVGIVCATLLGIAFCTLTPLYIHTKIEYGNDQETKVFRSWSIRSGIATFIFLLITIFTPSQNTVIAMIAANAVTPNAIEAAADAGRNVIDYLTETIEDLIDGVNEEETEEN